MDGRVSQIICKTAQYKQLKHGHWMFCFLVIQYTDVVRAYCKIRDGENALISTYSILYCTYCVLKLLIALAMYDKSSTNS